MTWLDVRPIGCHELSMMGADPAYLILERQDEMMKTTADSGSPGAIHSAGRRLSSILAVQVEQIAMHRELHRVFSLISPTCSPSLNSACVPRSVNQDRYVVKMSLLGTRRRRRNIPPRRAISG